MGALHVMHRTPLLKSSGPAGSMPRNPFLALSLRFFPLRGHLGQAAIRGIDDQRRPVLELSFDEPGLVVVPSIPVERAEIGALREGRTYQIVPEKGVAAVDNLRGFRLQLGELRVAQRCFVAESFKPLERGGTVVGPHPLEIGISRGTIARLVDEIS